MSWRVHLEEIVDDEPRFFRAQAELYVARLAAAVGLDPHMRVLEFGCGFGYVAARLAPRVREVVAWDVVPIRRRGGAARTRHCGNVRVPDLGEVEVAGWLAAGPRFDRILCNSVVQYLSAAEAETWLRRWRDLLAPGGCIVVSDLIPPRSGGWRDLADLVAFAARRRVLGPCLRWIGVYLLRYARAQRADPYLRIGGEEVHRLAAAGGLEVRVLGESLTHYRRRLTAVFTRPAAGD